MSQPSPWRGAALWSRSVDDSITLDTLLSRASVVTLGVASGGRDDALSMVVIGRMRDDIAFGTPVWLVWSRSTWPPSEEQIRPPGLLEDLVIKVPRAIALSELRSLAVRLLGSGKLLAGQGIGLDPYDAMDVLETLKDAGVEEHVCAVPQGWRLAGAQADLARRIDNDGLRHPGAGWLDHCVANARVETRGVTDIVTRQASCIGRLEALFALFNAAALLRGEVGQPKAAPKDEPVTRQQFEKVLAELGELKSMLATQLRPEGSGRMGPR